MWIDCIDITGRWDSFVLFHLYGNKGVLLPLWPIRQRWFHTFSPCAEPFGDGHEGMWAWFGSQGSIALNWHSCYSGTRYSGTWLHREMIFRYREICLISWYQEINSRYLKIATREASHSGPCNTALPHGPPITEQRPSATPAPAACRDRHYDISKSQCTYICNRKLISMLASPKSKLNCVKLMIISSPLVNSQTCDYSCMWRPSLRYQ